MMKFKLQS